MNINKLILLTYVLFLPTLTNAKTLKETYEVYNELIKDQDFSINQLPGINDHQEKYCKTSKIIGYLIETYKKHGKEECKDELELFRIICSPIWQVSKDISEKKPKYNALDIRKEIIKGAVTAITFDLYERSENWGKSPSSFIKGATKDEIKLLINKVYHIIKQENGSHTLDPITPRDSVCSSGSIKRRGSTKLDDGIGLGQIIGLSILDSFGLSALDRFKPLNLSKKDADRYGIINLKNNVKIANLYNNKNLRNRMRDIYSVLLEDETYKDFNFLELYERYLFDIKLQILSIHAILQNNSIYFNAGLTYEERLNIATCHYHTGACGSGKCSTVKDCYTKREGSRRYFNRVNNQSIVRGSQKGDIVNTGNYLHKSIFNILL